MLDPLKQMHWLSQFLEAVRRFPPSDLTETEARAWARSMSLIAEQVIDTDDEPAAA